MLRNRLLFVVVLGSFAMVFCGVPPGYAQEDESFEFQLEDIVVTALKREQDPQTILDEGILLNQELLDSGLVQSGLER